MAEDFAIVTELFIDGAWQNISADVRDSDECVIERGEPDESSNTRPGSLSFTLQNGRSNVAGNVIGRYTPRNAASDLFGKIGRNTPVRQSIEGHPRFYGEISEWPTSWGLAGEQDCWTRIKAYGILRRLGQGGGKPAMSALKRRLLNLLATVPFSQPVAFWPLDEGELVNVGEPLIGSSKFELVASTVPYFQFDRSELAPWIGTGLKIVPDATSSGQNITTFRAANVGMPAAVDEFSCEWYMRYGDGPTRITGTGANSAQTRMVLMGPPGPSQQVWQIQTDNFLNGGPGPGVTVSMTTGGTAEFTAQANFADFMQRDPCDGKVHHFHIRCDDVGATAIFFELRIDNKICLSFQDNTAPATLQGIDAIEFRNVAGSVSAGTAESPPVTIGHIALRVNATTPPFGENISFHTTHFAGTGNFGERAGRRIERLCEEEGIPFGFEGTSFDPGEQTPELGLDLTEVLGQQQIAPVLDLLDQAATADGGILYESRDSPIQNLLVGTGSLGTFEDGTTGSWVSPLAQNTVTTFSGGGHHGDWALEVIRITSSGPLEVWSNGTGAVPRTPVVPGQLLSASMWVDSLRAGQLATPDGRIRVEFFDAGNTSLGVTEGPFTSIPHLGWIFLSLTVAVPVGAVTMRVGYATGSIAVNDLADIDDVYIVRGAEPVFTKQFGAGGLVYATMEGLYNRAPALALNYSDGHISPPFDPVDDDQQLVNDAIAKRYAGGQRSFVKTAGPLSVALPPAGVGRYNREYQVNTSTDDRLLQHAAYRVEFGTFDESRFPEVGFRVRKWPELLIPYVAIDSGSWISIAKPPPWLPPETIGCMVRGYQERYSRADWSCNWWTIPSGLYAVGVVETDRLNTNDAMTAIDFTAGTDTTLSVAFNSPVVLVGANSFATTPNHASFAVTDLDFKIDLALDDWSPSLTTEIAGRQLLTGNQRSWLLYMGTDGSIRLRWSTDGTAELDSISTFKPLLPAGGRLALRVQLDVDNGAGGRTTTFYSAPTIAGPWTQVDQIIVGATTTIFASTAPLDIGDVQTSGFEPMKGRVYAAELLNGINGAAVANPDFTDVPAGSDVTGFTDASGKVWTMTGAKVDRREPAATGASDYNLRIAGSVLHVTNVADALGVQTFTVDQAPVNGIRKLIPARSTVGLDKPWRLAL